MDQQKRYFWDAIDAFNKAGVLSNIAIIGSWAEYIYQYSGELKGFQANLRTRDADILICNIRKPSEKVKLKEYFESNGFITLVESETGITKFIKGGAIEIEFIVNEMGKGKLEPYDIVPLGIKAEGLRHMGIILENLIETKNVVLLQNPEGNNTTLEYIVLVPSPQAYLLHKLIINDKRGAKSEKDKMASFALLDKIGEYEEEIIELIELYKRINPNDKKKVDKVCKDNFRKLFSDQY